MKCNVLNFYQHFTHTPIHTLPSFLALPFATFKYNSSESIKLYKRIVAIFFEFSFFVAYCQIRIVESEGFFMF